MQPTPEASPIAIVTFLGVWGFPALAAVVSKMELLPHTAAVGIAATLMLGSMAVWAVREAEAG